MGEFQFILGYMFTSSGIFPDVVCSLVDRGSTLTCIMSDCAILSPTVGCYQMYQTLPVSCRGTSHTTGYSNKVVLFGSFSGKTGEVGHNLL